MMQSTGIPHLHENADNLKKNRSILMEILKNLKPFDGSLFRS